MHRGMIDHRPKGFRKIFCATPGCGQQGELIDHTANGMVPNVIKRRFEQKGWEVGRDSSDDWCPSCVKTRQDLRRAKRLKAIPEPKAPQQEEIMVSVTNGAEHPVGMTRMDRRIIHAKLEEVYESEEVGYKPGWTDLVVAKHLGQHIPLGWVSTVREESFGPAKDNEEIRSMLERVAEAATATKVLLDDCKKLRPDVSAVVEQTNALMKRAGEVGKTLDGLLAIAERIEKQVRP